MRLKLSLVKLQRTLTLSRLLSGHFVVWTMFMSTVFRPDVRAARTRSGPPGAAAFFLNSFGRSDRIEKGHVLHTDQCQVCAQPSTDSAHLILTTALPAVR